MGLGHGGDEVGELVPLGSLKAGAQVVVGAGLLDGLLPPLAAVVDAGDAGHAKDQAVQQRQVVGVFQNAGRPGDVVVVAEAQKVFALIEGPVLRAELALEAVDDLKEVHGVETGVEPLVALVVGAAVEHLVVDPLVVVPVEGLTHQEKFRFQAVGEGAQALDKIFVQAVGHVQAQPIDVKLLRPEAHAVQQVVHHLGVAQVELHQLEVALPALVPEAVVVVGVAVKADMEPVLVGGIPLFLLHVPEGPKTPAHMVEHPVQHHPDAVVVEGAAHLGKVLVGAQAAVHLAVVPGVVAVAVAFKDGREVEGVHPQLLHVFRPVADFGDAVYGDSVVFQGSAAKAQRIDLIKYTVFRPHDKSSFLPRTARLFQFTTIPLPLESGSFDRFVQGAGRKNFQPGAQRDVAREKKG